MYRIGRYNADDRMCDLVCERYPVLLIMSRFGIALGFDDKTIGEVCRASGVDTATFLAVVNMPAAGEGAPDPATVSAGALLSYLRRSHDYFLDFRLPAIRRKLIEAVDCSRSDVAFAMLRFFDEYVAEVHRHMDYEERKVFPYVDALLAGSRPEGYSIDVFRRHHDRIEAKLAELKRIIIRYYPGGSTNELNGVLFDIFTSERDLASHNAVEDRLFIPAIKRLEEEVVAAAFPEPGGEDADPNRAEPGSVAQAGKTVRDDDTGSASESVRTEGIRKTGPTRPSGSSDAGRPRRQREGKGGRR